MAWYNCRMGGGIVDEDSTGISIASGDTCKTRTFTLTQSHVDKYGVDFDDVTSDNFYIHATGMTVYYGNINNWDKNVWPDVNYQPPKITYNKDKHEITVPHSQNYCSFIGTNDQNQGEGEQIFRVAITYKLYFLPFLKRS